MDALEFGPGEELSLKPHLNCNCTVQRRPGIDEECGERNL
jgi:hypothetical protein